MIFISEQESSALVTHELAYEAVKEALIAACKPTTSTFPVVLGHGSDVKNRFTIKSASDDNAAGLKVGSYFPSNDIAGLPRHSSIIFLFDQSKGRIGAVVEGSMLNAYRTAAADAVATDALARGDAESLAIIGTGHQAEFEVAAISRIRKLNRVMIVGRSEAGANKLKDRLESQGIESEICGAETACRQADIIVTATTSTGPLFEKAWVQPGTHISTMGSDATGKQELPPELFSEASLFCDLVEQSLRIGEFQHLKANGNVTPIGKVLTTETIGRRSEDDVTIFDSSGVSIQDLYIAQRVIAAHKAGGDERAARP